MDEMIAYGDGRLMSAWLIGSFWYRSFGGEETVCSRFTLTLHA